MFFRLRNGLTLSLAGARDDEGQALVEYALLLALIATFSVVAVQIFGLKLANLYSSIVNQVP